MKKFIAGIALLAVLSVPMFSATGLKLFFGPAITNLNYSEDMDPFVQKAQFKFAGGVGFEFAFTPMFRMEVDVMYAPGGAKFLYDIYDYDFRATGYGIAVPVLFKVVFMPGSSPFALVGGSFGYSLSQKLKLVSPIEDEEDYTDDINRFFYGLVFGGGYELNLSGMTFVVEVRYVLGLSNLIKEPYGDESLKTSNIYILFGYRF